MPFFITLIFILNPLLSIPLIFIELLNKKKYAIYLFSATMGFMGYVLIPGESADIVRLYERFEELKGYNFIQLLDFLKTQLDFIFFLYAWILGKLGISKQFLQFTSLLITYFLFISIYLDWSNKNTIELRRRVIFLFLIVLFVPFLSTYSGIRNNTALSFFIYGIYQIEFNKKKVGIIYLLLGNLTHFMTLFLTFIYLSSKYIKWKTKNIRYLYFTSFLFLIIPSNPFVDWLNTINLGFEFIESRQFSYLGSSEWSNFFLTDLSLKGKIFFVLTLLPYFLSLIYLILTNKESSIRNFAYYLAIFTNILSSVPGTLYKRYCTALIFLSILLILYEYKEVLWYRTKIFYLYTYLVLFLIMRLSDIYTTRYSIGKSYKQIMIYNVSSYFNKEIEEQDYIRER